MNTSATTTNITKSRWNSTTTTIPVLNVEITSPLKYLSNFFRFLDLPLVNHEIELDLSWTKD